MIQKDSVKTIYIGEMHGTPLGVVWVAVSERGLWAVEFGVERKTFERAVRRRGNVNIVYDHEKVGSALEQLREYLGGERRTFSVDIDWSDMTPFEEQSLRAVMAIPYGETRSYGQIAVAINQPGSARAVGRANAANPLPLVIPCHRVIAADGGLQGYGGTGGVKTKAWLLQLEGARMI